MIVDACGIGLSGIQGSPLPYDMIVDSVEKACDFFHIEYPVKIEPGHTMAINFGDPNTYGDEVLFFNHAQLETMGITSQDSLDLIMTHEGAHFILQDLDTGFDCYQKELCCDYMMGVRAGLNDMDITQLENSLIDLPQGLRHPAGILRVDAIEQGMAFAHNYMQTHDLPPTFNECLEDFKGDYMHDTAHLARLNNEAYAEECTMKHYRRLMDNNPTNESAQEQFQISEARHHYALRNYNQWHTLSGRDDGGVQGPSHGQYNPVFKGNLWTKAEIDSHKYHAKHEMDYQQSQINYYSKVVTDRASAGQPHSEASHQLNVAKAKYNAAKADYNKWCNEKPKDK